MDINSSRVLNFREEVGLKFQLYNSLFTALPFHKIEKTGILLSLFLSVCEDGYANKKSPLSIISNFFKKHTNYATTKEELDLLFRFVQYAERQVVLFDALEDAAFSSINDINGQGTLKHLGSEIVQLNKEKQLAEKLKDYSVRLVLTAHPTQFYPGPVLAIINDMSKALMNENTSKVNMYLQQLGKTAFFKKQKPTPYDEAISLIWFLENVFYEATGQITNFLKSNFPDAMPAKNPVVKMGFWPGGDRDGNPFVSTDTTLKVADALRSSIIKCYYLDIRKIRRRLTFEGVEEKLFALEKILYDNVFIPGQRTKITKEEILSSLEDIRKVLMERHNGIFVNLLDGLINKVSVFGLHFASLDIRQDSSLHQKLYQNISKLTNLLGDNYEKASDIEKISRIIKLKPIPGNVDLSDAIEKDTIDVVKSLKNIQLQNGEEGCNRYIISHSTSALNVMEAYGLFLLAGWKPKEITVDLVPLFETIEDLKNAAGVMQELYNDPVYKKHLLQRGNRQTIMVGFSDGTKDGGYLMANWGIYKAKEELTKVSRENNIEVIFFDGRGGPPARGGGKSHKFYASMGNNIENKEIQLTIQGQTVSSNFGMVQAARYNIEQLLHAGISNDLLTDHHVTMNESEEMLLQALAATSFESYDALKKHPMFLEYLGHASPLNFYGQTNIGSRPAKRGKSKKLSLDDLRAIPFVGAWSQLKQNVTGFYGVGTALQKADKDGRIKDYRKLYKNSLFFKTMIDNCEMAMKKCFFPLTAYLSRHPAYGELWKMIYKEYQLAEEYLFKITGTKELMADYPVEQLSIQMRERIVLPLVTIQQYAITKYRELDKSNRSEKLKETYGKLVMRCSFGIINAGRNSA